MMVGCGDDNMGFLKFGRMFVCVIDIDFHCVNVNLFLFIII